jgi:hypothetical protein
MDKEPRDITMLEYYDVTQSNPVIMKLETSKKKDCIIIQLKWGQKEY